MGQYRDPVCEELGLGHFCCELPGFFFDSEFEWDNNDCEGYIRFLSEKKGDLLNI